MRDSVIFCKKYYNRDGFTTYPILWLFVLVTYKEMFCRFCVCLCVCQISILQSWVCLTPSHSHTLSFFLLLSLNNSSKMNFEYWVTCIKVKLHCILSFNTSHHASNSNSIILSYAFEMRRDYLRTSYVNKKYPPSERSEMREIWNDKSNVCWDNLVSFWKHMFIFFSYLSLFYKWNLIRM